MSFTCTECHIEKDAYQHFDDDVCQSCAKKNGTYEAMDARPEIEQIAADKERAAIEQREDIQADFNKQTEAKRILAERELARRHMLHFVKQSNPAYQAGWVHADICQRLDKFAQGVEQGLHPRLMITMPPRHGKSELGSKTFPSWYLGRNPKHDVILTSYSGELAKDFSRKCRDLMDTNAFKNVFKTRLSKDSKASDKWSTAQGGGFTAAGVQGPITGRGAHLGIIDDPVKDREEAESETIRQKVKDWYSSTFYSRLAPGGGILIIQTRWHDDDLSGWLLSEMAEVEREMAEEGTEFWPEDADKWELVEYPAIAIQDEEFRKQGEALHPERYPLAALKRIKRAMIPRDWQALYQQKPVSEDGDYFKAEYFRYYHPKDLPPLSELRIYAAFDFAISQKTSADWTVGVVVGIDRKQNIWLLDMRRGRWNSLGIINLLFEIQMLYDPELMGIETGQIELALEPFIIKEEQERGVTLNYEKLRTKGVDKVIRARPLQGRMEQHKVFFPSLDSTPWMMTLVNELLKFPLGKNDDIVDALAWIGQMILLFGIVNQKQAKKAESDMAKRLKEIMNGKRARKAMAS